MASQEMLPTLLTTRTGRRVAKNPTDAVRGLNAVLACQLQKVCSVKEILLQVATFIAVDELLKSQANQQLYVCIA